MTELTSGIFNAAKDIYKNNKVKFSSVTSRGAACGDLYRHQNGTT